MDSDRLRVLRETHKLDQMFPDEISRSVSADEIAESLDATMMFIRWPGVSKVEILKRLIAMPDNEDDPEVVSSSIEILQEYLETLQALIEENYAESLQALKKLCR